VTWTIALVLTFINGDVRSYTEMGDFGSLEMCLEVASGLHRKLAANEDIIVIRTDCRQRVRALPHDWREWSE